VRGGAGRGQGEAAPRAAARREASRRRGQASRRRRRGKGSAAQAALRRLGAGGAAQARRRRRCVRRRRRAWRRRAWRRRARRRRAMRRGDRVEEGDVAVEGWAQACLSPGSSGHTATESPGQRDMSPWRVVRRPLSDAALRPARCLARFELSAQARRRPLNTL
jgi:hypothetical protein